MTEAQAGRNGAHPDGPLMKSHQPEVLYESSWAWVSAMSILRVSPCR
jgi:hypothetical protein